MEEVLILLAHDQPDAGMEAKNKIETGGGHVRQRYGPHVLIVEAPPELISSLKSEPGIAGIYEGAAPEQSAQPLDETGQIGIAAWNQRHSQAFRQAKSQRKGEGLAWDHPDFESEGRQKP